MAEISEKAEIADFSFFRFLSHRIEESVVFLQEIENLSIFRFYSHLAAISGNAEILVFSLFEYLSHMNLTSRSRLLARYQKFSSQQPASIQGTFALIQNMLKKRHRYGRRLTISSYENLSRLKEVA